MKKKYSSAIKFLAGTLAAVVVSCMVNVGMVKPQKVQAEEVPLTLSMNVSELSLPLESSFQLSAWLTPDPIESGKTVNWSWKSGDPSIVTPENGSGSNVYTIETAYKPEVVSKGAVATTVTVTATIDGKDTLSKSCSVTVNPRITSPVATPSTPPSTPSTPTTPTQPSTDPTEPSTPADPVEPTDPDTPPTPSEPDTPIAPAPGPDNPPVAPNPAPVETVPPANTIITGVTISDDGIVTKGKVLVPNAIVDDNGTKYITDGSAKKIVNQIVTTQDGTMYGTLADGRVAWSATFVLGGKKYYATADGTIAVKKFSTTPYDHKVYSRANGTLVRNKLFKVNGKRYYARKSGALVQSKWVKVGNKKYYCNAKGVITKSKKA